MDTNGGADDICVLCCRETTIFAVGKCDHHFCFECSSRMRVLCQQNECPICRSDMSIVIFSHKKELFSPSYKAKFLDKKFMIAFEDASIQDAFNKLLEQQCPKCIKVFDCFSDLERHVRREHSLNYCIVCADNLKLFTFERRCYDRKDLAHHNRKGDLDDKSHKGHQMCQPCQIRFMDMDELYRHLRKEHFFCHFCDADGYNKFFEDYEHMKDHFRTDHFLCEEDDCAKERFIGAFRSDIDFRAHRALQHTKNKTKAEVKQARNLGLEFNYAPRHPQNEASSPNQSDYRRRRTQNGHRRRNGEDNNFDRNDQDESSTSASVQTFNADCVEDFPLLSNALNLATHSSAGNKSESNFYSGVVSCPPYRLKTVQSKHPGARGMLEDFPALSTAFPGLYPVYPPLNPDALPLTSKTGAQTAQPQNRQTFSHHAQYKSAELTNSKIRSGNWIEKKKPLSMTSMSDFPQLKSTNRSAAGKQTMATKRPETAQSDFDSKESSLQKQKDESLAQQIYLKCKTTKVKNVPEVHVRNSFAPKTAKQEKPAENVPFALLYGGIGKHSAIENQENKNPMKEKMEEIARINKYQQRFKSSYSEEIPWHEPAKLVEDDFPPLGPTEPKCPPGFSSLARPSVSVLPPGFSDSAQPLGSAAGRNISLSSIAQQLTSDKTKKPYAESKLSPHHCYQEPVDFQERNNILICKIIELIGSNNRLFDDFKLLSGNFRKNKITASDYHASCLKILGNDKFRQLFPELLCLLPDIEKQQELLSVHEQLLKEDSKTHGAVPKKRLQTPHLFSTCTICSQVLAKRDSANHQTLHKNEINSLNR